MDENNIFCNNHVGSEINKEINIQVGEERAENIVGLYSPKQNIILLIQENFLLVRTARVFRMD